MDVPFGEYGDIFDDGKITLAHNGDYKPIPPEKAKLKEKVLTGKIS